MSLLVLTIVTRGSGVNTRSQHFRRLARDLHEPIAVAKGLRLDGVRVLLVEDDEDRREVLTLGLELQGAEVRAVGSAKDALRTVDGFCPHVILSDIGLPDEDGLS